MNSRRWVRWTLAVKTCPREDVVELSTVLKTPELSEWNEEMLEDELYSEKAKRLGEMRWFPRGQASKSTR